MFCGDETGALVGELGASCCKFGFAGEDLPKTSIPGWVGVSQARPTPAPTPTPASASSSSAAANSNDPSTNPARNDAADPRTPTRQLYVGSVSLGHRSVNMDITSPFRRGRTPDWDAVELMWSHACEHALSSSPGDHPLMVCASTLETTEVRAKYVELLFEKFSPPAVYIARNAMLAAFSTGRATALVVDVGASGSEAAAVVDGHVLLRNVVESSLGGDRLDALFQTTMEAKLGSALRPPCMLHRIVQPSDAAMGGGGSGPVGSDLTRRATCGGDGDGTSDAPELPRFVTSVRMKTAEEKSRVRHSYAQWQVRQIAQDAKHLLCRVAPRLNPKLDMPSSGASSANEDWSDPEVYELPDGTQVRLGVERLRIGEVLVKPKVTTEGPRAVGVPELAYQCVKSCTPEVRKELLQQTLLVGGCSSVQGFGERFQQELNEYLPNSYKSRVTVPLPLERQFANWIGGSILASLGTFQQMWISKAEFDEYGSAIVERRCCQ